MPRASCDECHFAAREDVDVPVRSPLLYSRIKQNEPGRIEGAQGGGRWCRRERARQGRSDWWWLEGAMGDVNDDAV